MSKEFIIAKITLRKQEPESDLKKLGIETDEENDEVSYSYNMPIRLISIDMVFPVPDVNGIPFADFCRIHINGMEYLIQYPVVKLFDELGITEQAWKEV